MKTLHGSVDVDVEEFQFDNKLFSGVIFVTYVRHSDGCLEWEPQLLRLTDVTDEDVKWEDDDDLSTIPFNNPLAKNLMINLDEYISDCCRDDCRFDDYFRLGE